MAREIIPFFAGVFRLEDGVDLERFAAVDPVVRFAEDLPLDGVAARTVRFVEVPLFVDRVFEAVDFARPLVLTVVRDVEVLDFEAAPSPRLVELAFDDADFALDEDVFLAGPLPERVVLLLEAAVLDRDADVDLETDPLDPDLDVEREDPDLDDVREADDFDDEVFDAEDGDFDLEGAEPFDLDELLLVLVAVRDLDEEGLEPDLDFPVCFVAAIRCLPS